jgi:hypothetical protein
VRRFPAILTAVLLLSLPALAQQQGQPAAPPAPAAAPAAQPAAAQPAQGQGGQEQAARSEGAAQQGQQPQPAQTGERSGTAGASTTGNVTLSQALVASWNQAVDLDGKPLNEPSQLAVTTGNLPAGGQPLAPPKQ